MQSAELTADFSCACNKNALKSDNREWKTENRRIVHPATMRTVVSIMSGDTRITQLAQLSGRQISFRSEKNRTQKTDVHIVKANVWSNSLVHASTSV